MAQGTQFGLGTAFLRFSREFERDADLLGSHIMAAAGYDPLEMASMFKTIEKQGGSGGPQWMSDHPNPGDRSAYITREARALQVRDVIRDTRAFTQVQARLRGMAPAPTTEDATRNATGGRGPRRRRLRDAGKSVGVESPSSSYTSYTEGDLFRVSVPSNWRELPGSNAVTFAPDGAYGNGGQGSSFTHGMEIGVARNETQDLRTATDELVSGFARSNPNLSRPSSLRANDDRRPAGAPHGPVERVECGRSAGTHRGLHDAAGRRQPLLRARRRSADRFSEYDGAFRRVIDSIEIMQ